ncbi:MAG: hypothetical protein B6I38_07015 [Anaerolineaceae bacterium 4572_5.1]|nr:MAG: hypothetical protein B6I38_07015 [Anaerolineaceae bacterium 4572_5.1]
MSVVETQEIDPRDRKNFQFQATPFRRGLVAVLSFIFRFFMDLTVEGLENFPQEGAVIVAANHVTNFDVFPMQLSLPRPIFYMAKSELFKNPIMDIALRNVGAFPVYRGGKDAWALNHARKALDHAQIARRLCGDTAGLWGLTRRGDPCGRPFFVVACSSGGDKPCPYAGRLFST